MTTFFLGVIGSLIGAGATAFLGFKIWERQQRHQARLLFLKETCSDFAELCRITEGDGDAAAITDCLLRLRSNSVLAEVIYGADVAGAFREAMQTIAGPGVALEQQKTLVLLLDAMARKLS